MSGGHCLGLKEDLSLADLGNMECAEVDNVKHRVNQAAAEIFHRRVVETRTGEDMKIDGIKRRLQKRGQPGSCCNRMMNGE